MDEHESRPRLEGQIGLVVGAGTELGAALARELAAAQMRVALVANAADTLASVTRGRLAESSEVRSFECDVTRPDDVDALFEAIAAAWGVPDLVVHDAGISGQGRLLDMDPEAFERCWRVGCMGGFLVGCAAARRMMARGSGTIVFTGTAASRRAGEGRSSLAVKAFGVRALAQAMARELGPHGVHVAHILVDGQLVSEETRDRAEREVPGALLAPRAVASTYLHVHQQHRSAWTHEIDLRPWVEPF